MDSSGKKPDKKIEIDNASLSDFFSFVDNAKSGIEIEIEKTPEITESVEPPKVNENQALNLLSSLLGVKSKSTETKSIVESKDDSIQQLERDIVLMSVEEPIEDSLPKTEPIVELKDEPAPTIVENNDSVEPPKVNENQALNLLSSLLGVKSKSTETKSIVESKDDSIQQLERDIVLMSVEEPIEDSLPKTEPIVEPIVELKDETAPTIVEEKQVAKLNINEKQALSMLGGLLNIKTKTKTLKENKKNTSSPVEIKKEVHDTKNVDITHKYEDEVEAVKKVISSKTDFTNIEEKKIEYDTNKLITSAANKIGHSIQSLSEQPDSAESELAALREEFATFKKVIGQQLAQLSSLTNTGSGSGEVNLLRLDDVDASALEGEILLDGTDGAGTDAGDRIILDGTDALGTDAGGAVDHEIGTNNLQFLRFNAVTNKIEFSDTLDGGVD